MPTVSAFLRALTALSRLRADLADLAPTRRSASAPAAPDEANVDALESALREVIPHPDEERTHDVQEEDQEDEAPQVHRRTREGPGRTRPEG